MIVRRHRRVTRRSLRTEVNRVLAELDAAKPGLLDLRDRERWVLRHPTAHGTI